MAPTPAPATSTPSVIPRPLSIAILDDQSAVRLALRRLLRSHGHQVTLFEDGFSLLASSPSSQFDCILLDLHMPGLSGFDVLTSLAASGPHPPVLIITGKDQHGHAQRSASLGAAAYLLKPLDESPLLAAIANCTAPSR